MEVIVVFKILLVSIFLISGVPKIFNFKKFIIGMQEYKLIPIKYLNALGLIFVISEITGAVLLFTKYVLIGTGLILFVLICYGIAVGINLVKKEEMDCHCFDTFGTTKLTWATLNRIILLAAITLYLAIHNNINVTIVDLNYSTLSIIAFLSISLLLFNELLQKGLELYSKIKDQYGVEY